MSCNNRRRPPVVTREQAMAAMPEARKPQAFSYLLGTSNNKKIAKSDAKGEYFTAILNLMPVITCWWYSPGCAAACLNTAGDGRQLAAKLKARKARTDLFFSNPAVFVALLVIELERHVNHCRRIGRKPACRLNGTSDVPWEQVCPWLFKMFSEVTFYDYTKGCSRLGKTPSNYWLTLSKSEENDFEVGLALARGFHVSVVMKDADKQQPNVWNGYATQDGDDDDLLFLRTNPVQLLYPKGRARQDRSGFVVPNGFVSVESLTA